MKNKNLVMIHLESLDYIRFQTNQGAWRYIHELESKAISFTNFFVSATSTLMTLSDLAYGDLKCNEKLKTLFDSTDSITESKSLPDRMLDLGYRFFMPFLAPEKDEDMMIRSEHQLIGKQARVTQYTDECQVRYEIEDFLSRDGEFFLWDVNTVHNIAHNVMIDEENAFLRWKKSQNHLQEHVFFIFEMLRKYNLLDKTTVVLYGDHGDDICTHGKHRGYTHATEPYASLTHTPLIIIDTRINKMLINNNLVGVEQIGELAERLALCGNDNIESILSNILPAEYVFSRNQFAVQKLQAGRFNKGYSITDGEWYLLVSNYGLSMHNLEMDPLCHHNFLDYFSFYEDNLILEYKSVVSLSSHFRHLLENVSLDMVIKKFDSLYKELKRRVNELFKFASCENNLYQIKFNEINYSDEEINRRLFIDKTNSELDMEVMLRNHFINYTETKKNFFEIDNNTKKPVFAEDIFDGINLDCSKSYIAPLVLEFDDETVDGWNIEKNDHETWHSPFQYKKIKEIINYVSNLGYDAIEANILDLQKDGKVCYRYLWNKSFETRVYRKVIQKRRKIFPIRFCIVTSNIFDYDMSRYSLTMEDLLKEPEKCFMGVGISAYDIVDFGVDTEPLIGKKVIIYGAGQYGHYCYKEIKKVANVVSWADKNFAMLPWQCGVEIEAIEIALCKQYDVIFVAITASQLRAHVYDMLKKLGVEEDKIL